jgi:hypothetical protein
MAGTSAVKKSTQGGAKKALAPIAIQLVEAAATGQMNPRERKFRPNLKLPSPG